MGEIILYILLIIFIIYIIAFISDLIKASNIIKKRKERYFSWRQFILVINMVPFNKEQRFKAYLEFFDPVSKLVLESIGFNSNEYNTYTSSEIKKIENKVSTYTNDTTKDFFSGKIDILNYINSDDFEAPSKWLDHPEFIFPYIFNIPMNYSINAPLSIDELNTIKELLNDEIVLKKIFSNNEFRKEIIFQISQISSLEFEASIANEKESENNYNKLTMLNSALNYAIIVDSEHKKSFNT
jgi:hypothetical protein